MCLILYKHTNTHTKNTNTVYLWVNNKVVLQTSSNADDYNISCMKN